MVEAEYVYRLRKDFVPLRLQCEYIPDGWLGILVGTRLYFDMYSEETFDVQLPKLVKELRERGRISPTGDLTDSGNIWLHLHVLILCQTSSGFHVSAVQVFRKHC